MNLQNRQLLRAANLIDGQWIEADGIEEYLEVKYLCFGINA